MLISNRAYYLATYEWVSHGGQGVLPRSHTVHDDLAGTHRGQGGDLLDDKDHQQLRDVVAVEHVGLAFIVEGREELTGGRFAFLEFGDLVELRSSYGKVCLCVVFRSRFAELGVEKKGEQRHGYNVGRDGLFVVFGHSKLLRPYAGVGDEHVDAWQFSLYSVGKGLNRIV